MKHKLPPHPDVRVVEGVSVVPPPSTDSRPGWKGQVCSEASRWNKTSFIEAASNWPEEFLFRHSGVLWQEER